MTALPAIEFPVAEQTAFLAAIEAAMPDTFGKLLDYEPKQFAGGKELPAVTMYYTSTLLEDRQTGPIVTATWAWRINVYCDLGRGYQAGQTQLKTLVPALVRAVTLDPSCGIDQRWFRLIDPGTEPTVEHDEALIWKTLRLEVELETISA